MTISGEVVYDEQEIRAENYRQWMPLNKLEGSLPWRCEGSAVAGGRVAFWSAESAQMNPRPHMAIVAASDLPIRLAQSGFTRALAVAGAIGIPKGVTSR
ncbi:MAG: hypothetical protein ACLSIL_16800 [Enterococcus casseliflavus]